MNWQNICIKKHTHKHITHCDTWTLQSSLFFSYFFFSKGVGGKSSSNKTLKRMIKISGLTDFNPMIKLKEPQKKRYTQPVTWITVIFFLLFFTSSSTYEYKVQMFIQHLKKKKCGKKYHHVNGNEAKLWMRSKIYVKNILIYTMRCTYLPTYMWKMLRRMLCWFVCHFKYNYSVRRQKTESRFKMINRHC